MQGRNGLDAVDMCDYVRVIARELGAGARAKFEDHATAERDESGDDGVIVIEGKYRTLRSVN